MLQLGKSIDNAVRHHVCGHTHGNQQISSLLLSILAAAAAAAASAMPGGLVCIGSKLGSAFVQLTWVITLQLAAAACDDPAAHATAASSRADSACKRMVSSAFILLTDAWATWMQQRRNGTRSMNTMQRSRWIPYACKPRC